MWPADRRHYYGSTMMSHNSHRLEECLEWMLLCLFELVLESCTRDSNEQYFVVVGVGVVVVVDDGDGDDGRANEGEYDCDDVRAEVL